ncbi:hypothetical protein BaRGS_00025270 [Batillaria attramentaria]|uniref:Uncharacterized protein n=1 Tax=Batillaria attramentaria TaxID=370345 RepID=A0ABD0K936_9CAEN
MTVRNYPRQCLDFFINSLYFISRRQLEVHQTLLNTVQVPDPCHKSVRTPPACACTAQEVFTPRSGTSRRPFRCHFGQEQHAAPTVLFRTV